MAEETALVPQEKPTLDIAALVGALKGLPAEQLLDLAIMRLRAALPPGTELTPVRPMSIPIITNAQLATLAKKQP
ncbi:MAG: hypothetical protein QM831_31420 [Kofleriaceae bacterium]